jgi:hypothetical protein
MKNKLLGSRGEIDVGVMILLGLALLVIAIFWGIYYKTKDNHKVGTKAFTITEQDLERIKSSMRVVKKDGKCYSIVVSYTYYDYPVVSHTLIPCD